MYWQIADKTSLRIVVSRDIPFTPSSASDDPDGGDSSEVQQFEEGWDDEGVGGALEDEGTVIVLAVTLAVVLVAITVVVVVFVCARSSEQRRGPDITDIRPRFLTLILSACVVRVP